MWEKKETQVPLVPEPEECQGPVGLKGGPWLSRADGKGVPDANHASLGKGWLLCTSHRRGLSDI